MLHKLCLSETMKSLCLCLYCSPCFGVSPWFTAARLWPPEPAVVEHEGRVNSSALVVALKEEQASYSQVRKHGGSFTYS